MAQPATPLPAPEPLAPPILRLLGQASAEQLTALAQALRSPAFAEQFGAEIQRALHVAERHTMLERMAEEQGIKPFDPDEWMARPHEPLTPEEWEPYMAAVNEGRAKP